MIPLCPFILAFWTPHHHHHHHQHHFRSHLNLRIPLPPKFPPLMASMETSSSSSDELQFSTPPAYLDSSKNPTKRKQKKKPSKHRPSPPPLEDDWRRRRGGEVMLEGYVQLVEGSDGGGMEGEDGAMGRTKSLTDEDLEELKGCLDLGFGFSYDEIPELCSTLPALELCYSMSQRFLDDQQQQQQGRSVGAAGEVVECSLAHSAPIANWRISNPGDHPDEVKARLKYWAQAVACTVRLCNS